MRGSYVVGRLERSTPGAASCLAHAWEGGMRISSLVVKGGCCLVQMQEYAIRGEYLSIFAVKLAEVIFGP